MSEFPREFERRLQVVESAEGGGSASQASPSLYSRDSRDADGRLLPPPGVTPVEHLSMRHTHEPPPREYLLDGIIPRGAATSMFGDGGVAKSLMALSLCAAVANGDRSWLGREVMQAPALYVDFELAEDEQIRRAKSLCRGSGYDGVPDDLHYMSVLGKDSMSAFWSAFRAVDETGAKLMVIDSLGLALEGSPEDASEIINFYRSRLEPFVDDGLALVLIDHQSKLGAGDSYQRKTSFGSVYKRNLVRSELQLEATAQDEDAGTLELILRHTKHNFGPKTKPFGARVGFHLDEIQVGPAEVDSTQMAQEVALNASDRVLLAMTNLVYPITAEDIAEEAELQVRTAKNALTGLKKNGKVRATGDKVGKLEVVELAPDVAQSPSSSSRPLRSSDDDDASSDFGRNSFDDIKIEEE